MTNLSIVREKVIAAVPEIGELISPFEQGFLLPQEDQPIKQIDGHPMATEVVLYQQTRNHVLKAIRMIRPIRLADIVALFKSSAFRQKKAISITALHETLGTLALKWIQPDSLDAQNDDTIDWLASLLSEKV